MSRSTTQTEAGAAQIKATRKRLGLSQAALAEKLGTTQSNVAKWEAGMYQPSPAQWMELAVLAEGSVEQIGFMSRAGVPNTWFEGKVPKGHVPTVLAENAIKDAEAKTLAQLAASGAITDLEGVIRYVPLLKDSAAAGTPRAVDEKEVKRLLPIPKEWLPLGGTLYGITVEGDSMEPILLSGHIVIVDTDSHDPAKLVNRMVVGRDDGITVKWLREDDGEYQLVPHHVSVRHPIRRLRKGRDLTIVGEVVQWIGFPPSPSKMPLTRKR